MGVRHEVKCSKIGPTNTGTDTRERRQRACGTELLPSFRLWLARSDENAGVCGHMFSLSVIEDSDKEMTHGQPREG